MNCFSGVPRCSTLFLTPSYWSVFYQVTRNRQPWQSTGVTCCPPNDGQPSRMKGCRVPQSHTSRLTLLHPGRPASRPCPIPRAAGSPQLPPSLCPRPVPVNEGLSTRGALIPRQHLEGGCLARAIDAQQPKALPGPHAHAQPVHGQDAPNLAGFVHLVGQGMGAQPVGRNPDPQPRPTSLDETAPRCLLAALEYRPLPPPPRCCTLVRFSIFSMSLSASPRRTRCRSLATSMSSSMGLVDTGRRLREGAGAGWGCGQGSSCLHPCRARAAPQFAPTGGAPSGKGS